VDSTRFVYEIYVSTSPEVLWNALLDPKVTEQYWQHHNVSDWEPGSSWEHRRCDAAGTCDLVGKVVEREPPRRLVITWAAPGDEATAGKVSTVTFEIGTVHEVAHLTVTHDHLEPGSEMLTGITDGWPKVLSSLKSLLETGKPLPQLW
jgi:uncharacterized protein YndB with AHSA1/START domain